MSRTITAVELHKRSQRRYNIYLDGELAFSVHEDVLVSHRLAKGTVVSQQELEQLLADEERQLAWNAAVGLLGRRMRSCKEMRDYLTRKGHADELAGEIVSRLTEQGYLNDADFTAQWIGHRLDVQSKGSRWIREELKQKGIAAELVSSSMSEVEENREAESAYRLALKKWRLMKGEIWERRYKLKGYLLRRGYPGRIVQETVSRVSGETSADDELYEDEYDE